jgi:hypothetical protein
MRRRPAVLRILKAECVHGHTLKLVFSNDIERMVDFKPFLGSSRHPNIRKYLRPSAFKKFLLKDGDLMWGDFDLIFPIMDLYENRITKPAQKRSQARGGASRHT